VGRVDLDGNWLITRADPTFKAERATEWLSSVAVDPTGSYLAVANRAKLLRVYRVEDCSLRAAADFWSGMYPQVAWMMRTDSGVDPMLVIAGSDGLFGMKLPPEP